MRNFLKIHLVLILFGFSCSESKDPALCTTEFAEVNIEVYDLKGTLVELEDFQVINLYTNTDITSSLQNEFFMKEVSTQ